MRDIINAIEVEIIIDHHNKLWININGVCAMRVGYSKIIIVEDVGKKILEVNRDP